MTIHVVLTKWMANS